MLPNIIVRHYDQAHGARRLTQRPWIADAYTKDVVNTFIDGKESLTMLLQNSPLFRSWLQSNLDKDADVSCRSGLSAGIRKHRFDSTQLPLARAVLRHFPLVLTAQNIAKARKGEAAADCAEYFLIYISGREGMKRLLLLAMLADAGDESMLMVRAHDKQKCNPADTAFWMSTYVQRIQTCVLEGAVTRTGFTEHMLETLKKPIFYNVRL